jgi:hypothetical protein
MSEKELEGAAPRVAQLRKMDLIGQAVAKSASELQSVIRYAASAV